MKELIRNLLRKPVIKYLYDFMLEHDDEVRGKEPKLYRELAPDMRLELYVVPLPQGGEYAKAIITVLTGRVRVYLKYDTGRVNGDYEAMLDDCQANIEFGWGLASFREQAKREADNQLGLFDHWMYSN